MDASCMVKRPVFIAEFVPGLPEEHTFAVRKISACFGQNRTVEMLSLSIWHMKKELDTSARFTRRFVIAFAIVEAIMIAWMILTKVRH
jgi:hypothetical protein